MKKTIAIVLLTTLVIWTGVALGSTIKSWSSGDVVRAADLNANFTHIHNTMVGGHGARLVNADVSASAAIAHSKMATPALLPKAWAFIASCNTSITCTQTVGTGVTSVTSNATAGQYVITWATPRANANYIVVITSNTASTFCVTNTYTTTTAAVECLDDADAPHIAGFGFILMDDA